MSVNDRHLLDRVWRRLSGDHARLWYHIDSPTSWRVPCVGRFVVRGWAASPRGLPVSVFRTVVGHDRAAVPLTEDRPDVLERLPGRFASAQARCGFETVVELRRYPRDQPLRVFLEFECDGRVRRTRDFVVEDLPGVVRSDYKAVWNQAAYSPKEATRAVAGYTNEEELQRVGEQTVSMLRSCVGVHATDDVLEIGAGVGRVGDQLAPLVRTWTGADVSENMLEVMRQRLARHANVRALALNGYDLTGVAPASLDLVYSTVVFMHLDEWERWSYVREAYRVLKPGGRLLVDNFNLLSEAGWAFFLETMSQYHPLDRPPNVSRPSTPQELRAYFDRAGFADIRQIEVERWIITFGVKPGPSLEP